MEYEWDLLKAEQNAAKHGVRFEQVSGFNWKNAAVKRDERRDYGERRYIAVGPIDGRLHVLVFTVRGRKVRVIGLRKANARERIRHERTKEAFLDFPERLG